MGFDIFDKKEKKTGFAVFSSTPRDTGLATGMAGTTLRKKTLPSPAPKASKANVEKLVDELFVDSPSSMADFRRLDQESLKQQVSLTPKKEPTPTFKEFVAKGDPAFVAKHPTASKVMAAPGYAMQTIADLFPQGVQNWANRAGTTGGEIMTMVDAPNAPTTGSTVGDVTADLAGAIMGFVANPVGGPGSLGANIWRGTEQTIGQIAPRIPGVRSIPSVLTKGVEKVAPKLASETVEELVKHGGKLTGATMAFEGTRALANEREMSPEEMALAVGANVALDLGTMGVLKGLGRKRAPTAQERSSDFDWLMADEVTSPSRTEPLALPPGPEKPLLEQGVNWRYWQEPSAESIFYAYPDGTIRTEPYKPVPVDFTAEPGGVIHRGQPRALLPAGPESPLMLGQGVKTDFHVDPYGVARTEPGMPLQLSEGNIRKSSLLEMRDEPRFARSDIGDPAYLAELQTRYNELVNTEVVNLKQDIGGVILFGNADIGYQRGSLNPAWYRDFYAQNGRPPREGEFRDIAIRNLIKGNPDTGEPPNQEFLSVLSELSRGQRLPEEWHGLQQSIRQWEGQEGLEPLTSEAMQRQAEIEPYGLQRDVSRLTEVENQARGRMTDQADYGQYEGVKFKRADAVSEPTETPEFKRWFGDSKVVDEQGKPLVVYHNTNADFNAFDVSKSRQSQDIPGIFFTDSPTEWADMGKRQIQAHLSIKNPYIGDYTNYKGIRGGSTDTAFQKIRDALIKDGYDGIITKDGGTTEYIAFFPEQVKSVYNRGTFDPTNPDIRYKYADSTAQPGTPEADLEVLQRAIKQRKLGPFTVNKIELAPEALSRPKFQAASAIAEELGLRLVAFKGKGARGIQSGRTIYLNENLKDPLDYVFWHEVGHTMEVTHPEHYDRLMGIALDHIQDAHKLQSHYKAQDYALEDMPHEFATDVFAESLATPGFFEKLKNEAPELIKPLLEAIEQLIARIKQAVSNDDSVLPYLRDIEALQERIRKEVVEPYFKDAMGEKKFVEMFGHKWQESAAKTNAETRIDPTETPEFKRWFGNSKVVDEQGNPLVVYHGTNKDFSVFSGESAGDKTGNPTAGWGFFFTHRPAEASSYATDWTKEGGNVMPVYVSVKNPYIMPYSEYRQFTHLDNLSEGQAGLNRLADLAQQRKKELIEQGYDGIYVMQGDYNGKHITDSVGEIVAFEPTQIKSIYNQGTWDPTNPDIRYNVERIHQAISSANTSLNQIAATFKNNHFVPGKVNIDIGGGKYDKGTNYLKETYGTENLVYDPFNRSVDQNRIITDRLLSGERGDTATVNNVLNVIAEPEVRVNVIKQAAKAIKPNGKTYFLIYEGDKSGIGKQTIKGWQNNAKADTYIKEIAQYFDQVERKGTLIIASNPKKIDGPAIWKLGDKQQIRFKLGEERPIVDDLRAMIEYGAENLHKGGYEHFAKQIQKQFAQQLEGYKPEVQEQLMKDVWLRAKELRNTGQTQIELGGQVIPVTRQAQQKATSARPLRTENVENVDGGTIPDTRQHIVSKTKREPIVASKIAEQTYIKAVDDLYKIDEIDKIVAKATGKKLSPEDKAYLLAINTRESSGITKTILEDNLADSKGNIIGLSFKQILTKIPEGMEQEFRDYLILRNSISWMDQGKQVYPKEWNMTTEKAMQKLAQYDNQYPELKQAADAYVNWHRQMAKAWLVDTGIITPETWQAFQQAHPYYVPFQRQMKPVETTPGQGKAKRGFANQTDPTKRAEGSERPIVDPIESTIEQVDRYVATAKRNEVMQALIRNMEKAPEELQPFVEVIPQKRGDVLDDINTILTKDGLDGVIEYLDEPFEQMFARRSATEQPLNKPNVVRAFVNGERVHVKVNDPVLLDALTALSDTGRNAVVEAFRTATRVMKVLTTGGNPIFATRNIARDVPLSYVASETLSKTPGIREVQFAWDMLDSLARIVTNEKWHPDKYYREYKALGGGTHTSSMAADRKVLSESMARVLPSEKNLVTKAGDIPKKGFQGIERFTSTVEALPRLPEYIRTVKKGGNTYASKLEGLHASQDITVNFSRRGKISRDADAFIPYFNAAIQGIDKIARLFAKDPIGASYRSIVAVTVPTVGLYLLNKDNPNYHRLSNYVRDNYYCLPKNNGQEFIKIAKPREIGVVFSDLPERLLRKWEADDPEGFYQFSEAWLNNFVPPGRPIIAPFYDVMANKDFAERSIVPGYMQGLSPQYQYDESTSMAARKLGEALNLSPKQIDYIFSSYGGVIGDLAIPAMSEGRGQNMGQRLGEVLDRNFTADPLYSNDIVNKFYEQKDRLDKANKDYNSTGQKNKDYNPQQRTLYNRQANRISNIRKEIRRINADSTLSFREKEKRTRKLQANIVDIAQKTVSDKFPPRAQLGT